MSFGKTRVPRFNEKSEFQSQIPKKMNSTEICNSNSNRSRCNSASAETRTPDTKNLNSDSFSEAVSPQIITDQETNDVNKKRPKSTTTRPSKIAKAVIGRPQTGNKQQSLNLEGDIRDSNNGEDKTAKPAVSKLSNVGQRKNETQQKRTLESTFTQKLTAYNKLRKELLDKQKPVLTMYRYLMTLRKKLLELDSKPAQVEGFEVIENAVINTENEKVQEQAKEVKSKLVMFPSVFVSLCRRLLDEKCSILDKVFNNDGEWNQDDLLQRIQEYKNEMTILDGQIQSSIKEEESKMKDIVKEYNTLVRLHPDYDEENRSDQDKKLIEMEIKLKQLISDLQVEKEKKLKNQDKIHDLEKELNKAKEKITELNKAIEDEHTKNLGVKTRFETYDQKLKSAKSRIKELENLQQEYENKLKESEKRQKKTEDDWILKYEYLEAQNKDLQHYAKTQNESVVKMESERRALNVRCQDLEDLIATKDEEHEKLIKQMEEDYKQNIRDLQRELMSNSKKSIETNNNGINQDSEELVTLCHKIIDYSCKSETELTLWNELKATKSSLRLVEEKLALYAEEKVRFLETLKQREDDSETVSLTKHLMQNEELITNLILQNKQLKRTLHEIKDELYYKSQTNQEMQEKLNMCNALGNTTNIQHLYMELHEKLNNEITQNKMLEHDMNKMCSEKEQLFTMVKDFEHLFNVREQMLNAYKSKYQATETQNADLKNYIQQLTDQLSVFGTKYTEKEHEIKTLAKLIDEKNAYIEKIEERIDELERCVDHIKLKRVNLYGIFNKLDNEISVARTQISQYSKRPVVNQFINHVKTLSIQEETIRQKKNEPIVHDTTQNIMYQQQTSHSNIIVINTQSNANHTNDNHNKISKCNMFNFATGDTLENNYKNERKVTCI